MKKYIILVYVVLSCIMGSFAQKKTTEFTRENYLEDFDFIVKLIKEQHPNPFRFIAKDKFDEQTTVLRNQLMERPTLETFFLANPLALIHDAHLELLPDGDVYSAFIKQGMFFPLNTTVYDNRVFVNQYVKEVPIGAELIQVNGQSVQDIIKQIPPKVDGDIVASTQKDFGQYASILFPHSSYFTIVYRENSLTPLQTVNLKAVDFDRCNYNRNKSVLPLKVLAYSSGIYGSVLDQETYLLQINSFALSEDYAYAILNTVFSEIKDKKIKQVILDIRDNSGGSLTNIPLFYSFISQTKHFENTYRYATKVPYIKVKENLIDDTNRLMNRTDITNLDNYMQQRFDQNEADGFYYGNDRLEESYVANYPQDKNAFTGKVILIQNNNTISAAAYFAYMFQQNKRGVIVGQETRSCSNFTTAAWFLNYKLPNTESIVALPRSEIFFNTVANKDCHCRGVIPDYSISADQYQLGLQEVEDAELKMALSLLKK